MLLYQLGNTVDPKNRLLIGIILPNKYLRTNNRLTGWTGWESAMTTFKLELIYN